MSDLVERLKKRFCASYALTPAGPKGIVEPDEDCHEAASEIERLRAALEWRSIESAPGDGIEFLVWAAEYSTPTVALKENGAWFTPDLYPHGWTELLTAPTHWAPFPKPPGKSILPTRASD